jgi:hypothetical protein
LRYIGLQGELASYFFCLNSHTTLLFSALAHVVTPPTSVILSFKMTARISRSSVRRIIHRPNGGSSSFERPGHQQQWSQQTLLASNSVRRLHPGILLG